MERTGTINLPLHRGKAPRWLFSRMTRLARNITTVIVKEYDADEMLSRLSDPIWFQGFGCLLGFDWHSSGLTTTVCGALKEGLKDIENEVGFFVCGGKGGTSRKTPREIEMHCEKVGMENNNLVYASRMSAKVDSAGLQDGYQLYHHNLFFTKKGRWCVIQQGMNDLRKDARRYHWLGSKVSDFVCEPHNAICCDNSGEILNMVHSSSSVAREVSWRAFREHPESIIKEFRRLKGLRMPRRHHIEIRDIDQRWFERMWLKTYESTPAGFEELLGIKGVGPKAIRALALIAELIYDAPASRIDPVRYSFAHGGKDGTPYPVDKETFDQSIKFLREMLGRSHVGYYEKKRAFSRLAWFGDSKGLD